ncbi:MAG: enoyl-CoA hydratase/isomerase family protein [Myxococcales bacterium]|nr:enoyl-CoA hydratase/isomerase family protein [Myxococcales bacterium]
MSDSSPVVVAHRTPEDIVVVTVSRPSHRNALSLEVVEALRAEVAQAAADDTIRALILTGAGGVFVSGADIAELKERTRADALRRINTSLFRAIETLPFPTIAAIEAYALGGGLELALACDLRVGTTSSRYGQPEVGLGIIPGAGATYRLPRVVGLGNARELIFTGTLISAEHAHRIGLLNRVTPDGGALAGALELARTIGRNSGLAVRFSKSLLNLSQELTVDGAMAYESTAQAVLFETEDKRARMSAFLERRAGSPKSKGSTE